MKDNKLMKNRLILLILLPLFSCSTKIDNTENLKQQVSNKEIVSNIKTEINPQMILKGKVDFGNSFKVKANIATNEIVTVSLIYFPTVGEVVANPILAGTTNSDGSFELEPLNNLVLNTGDTFILEAMKRVSPDNNEIITLRTYVQWNGNGWDSISKTGVLINTYTTALTIISNSKSDIINPKITIKAIDFTNNIPIISSIVGVTLDVINQVNSQINSVLSDNSDPVASIKYNPTTQIYSISNAINIGKIDPLRDCGGCDKNSLIGLKYSGQEQIGWNMQNKNLQQSDLSYNNMKQSNFSGSNISNANLSGVNLVGATLLNVNFNNSKMEVSNLGGAILKGSNLSEIKGYLLNIDYADVSNVNLSKSDLHYANFSHSNLSNTNATNSNFSNGSLEGAVITGTDFSGANMSYTKWIDGSTFDDGKICAQGSIGACN